MDFDPDFYLNYYKDLRLAGIKTDKEALQHYTTYGKKEGRYANSKQINPHINYNNFNANDLVKPSSLIMGVIVGTFFSITFVLIFGKSK